MKGLYKNVPVLDTGARGSTTTFVQRGIGDVLVGWENEAMLAIDEVGPGKFEIVRPSMSILAEPPVSVVDKVVDKHGTRKAAEAYLRFLYTDAAQDLAARRHFRPRNQAILAKYAKEFPKMDLVTIDQVVFKCGWAKAQAKNFADGGTFDKILLPPGWEGLCAQAGAPPPLAGASPIARGKERRYILSPPPRGEGDPEGVEGAPAERRAR